MKNNFRFRQIMKLRGILIKSKKGSKPSSNLLITWLKVYAITNPWEFAYNVPASAEQLF